jgi:hypothetical protein
VLVTEKITQSRIFASKFMGVEEHRKLLVVMLHVEK